MNTTNKIYIIGAGAIGKALAVLLKKNGRDVMLIRASVDEQLDYAKKIQLSLSNNNEIEAEVQISTINNFKELNGLIVLTNKSYGNERVANLLKGKTNNSPIIILQNGLGVENVFLSKGFPAIYRCVLFATSQIDENGRINFKPVMASPVGVIKGNDDELMNIIALIDTPIFKFNAGTDIQQVVWKKTIVNSVFNSVCPLLDADNGIFFRNKNALAIAQRVMEECINVAVNYGAVFTLEELTETLLLISQSSNGQFISTLQDIRKKRETEIETLNFEIVKLAKQAGLQNNVTNTKLLGELIKLKSALAN